MYVRVRESTSAKKSGIKKKENYSGMYVSI